MRDKLAKTVGCSVSSVLGYGCNSVHKIVRDFAVISIYKDGDDAAWVPVAKGKSGGPPRPFLPFRGTGGLYTYGYKGRPEKGYYFDALTVIQNAYLADERQVFTVNGRKKAELQKRAKWRHGVSRGDPLLFPTLGWVSVPTSQLETVPASKLAQALLGSGKKYVFLLGESIQPVICETAEDLGAEAAKLRNVIKGKIPIGQSIPKSVRSSVVQYARDAAVVAYTLHTAGGECELCKTEAPFRKFDGQPYLEVHHVRPLANGGSDTLSNTVALCPNCHRELHHGSEAKDRISELYERLERLTPE